MSLCPQLVRGRWRYHCNLNQHFAKPLKLFTYDFLPITPSLDVLTYHDMIETHTLRGVPSGARAIDWSDDGIIAIAAAEQVQLLVR